MSPPACGSQRCHPECRQRGAVGLPECLWRWPSGHRRGHRRGQVCLIVSRCPWTGLGKPEAAWPAVAACWGEGGGEPAGRSCLPPAQSSHDPNSLEHSTHPRSAFLGPPPPFRRLPSPSPLSWELPRTDRRGPDLTGRAWDPPEAPPSSPPPPRPQLSQALLINLKVKDLN